MEEVSSLQLINNVDSIFLGQGHITSYDDEDDDNSKPAFIHEENNLT